MRRRQKSPLWPYLGILTCLFVLSITAPRAWDRMARQHTLNQRLAERRAREASTQAMLAPRTASRDRETYEPLEAAELEVRNSIFENVAISPRPATGEQPATASRSVEPPTAEVEPVAPSPPQIPTSPELAPPMVQRPVAEPPAETATASLGDVAAAESDTADETVQDAADGEAPPTTVWPLPRMLVSQLDRLIEADPGARWAASSLDLIHELCQGGPRPAAEIVKDLQQLLERSAPAATNDPAVESRALRARSALARWVDIWESAIALSAEAEPQPAARPDPARVQARLQDVAASIGRGLAGIAWRQYLRLDELRTAIKTAESASDESLHAAARHTLDRMDSSRLTRAQRKYLERNPFVELQAELRPWAAAAVTPTQLLTHLEQYEQSGLASQGRLVADDWRGLNWSNREQFDEISGHVDTHYRNANFRVAASSALLNRMVPQPDRVDAPVRDTVVNVPVYGCSSTFTKLSVQLVPDPQRVRLGLEAHGLVDSDTYSTSGPVTIRSAGRSTFVVRKLMVLGPHGLSVWPAVSEAANSNYLVSLDTNFDGVPLVGSLVRNIAMNQHEEVREEARLEVQQKVAIKASAQLDAEVRPRLVKAAETVQQKQLATIERLGLELVPVGLTTTEERITARARLATPEQLGAHTPRPRAPSDSWFSMQVHESALNNVIEQLKLDGREFSLPELFKWISLKLDRPTLSELEDLPEDVHLKFAERDAVRLRLDGNQVEVVLSLAEMTQGRNHWRNFTVRTFYRPEAQERSPRFVRDSTIFLEGRSLKGKPQVVLRAIFSKVLSRNRDIRLLNESFTDDPRLHDLSITQFVVEDGWIGLAYSRRQLPPNVARRPE